MLSILGERIPEAMYIHAMIPRFAEEELLHAETMCMGTKGLAIAVDMLNALLSGSPPGVVSRRDVGHLIETLDKPYFWQLLSEDEELIYGTAKLLQVMVTRHTSQLDLTDTLCNSIVWFATVLRAASRIYHSNSSSATSVQENTAITEIVNQIIGSFNQDASMISSVYERHLTALFKRLCGRPNAWKSSSMELYVLEILVESITGDDLEDAGVTEQLVELVCYAGSRPTKENQEIGDILVRKRYMISSSCCLHYHRLSNQSCIKGHCNCYHHFSKVIIISVITSKRFSSIC